MHDKIAHNKLLWFDALSDSAHTESFSIEIVPIVFIFLGALNSGGSQTQFGDLKSNKKLFSNHYPTRIFCPSFWDIFTATGVYDPPPPPT